MCPLKEKYTRYWQGKNGGFAAPKGTECRKGRRKRASQKRGGRGCRIPYHKAHLVDYTGGKIHVNATLNPKGNANRAGASSQERKSRERCRKGRGSLLREGINKSCTSVLETTAEGEGGLAGD